MFHADIQPNTATITMAKGRSVARASAAVLTAQPKQVPISQRRLRFSSPAEASISEPAMAPRPMPDISRPRSSEPPPRMSSLNAGSSVFSGMPNRKATTDSMMRPKTGGFART